jgi:DNA-binding transcriptional MerR regulator
MPPRRRPPDPRTVAVHPIQVVTRRTGLSADVLRVWEKRYAAVTPARTASERRLYSEADVERLTLLAEATLTGRSIGQVATLSDASLATLVREARDDAAAGFAVAPARARARGTGKRGRAVPPPVPAPGAGRDGARASAEAASHATSVTDALRLACLAAIADFDGVALRLALARAGVTLAAETFLGAIATPLADAVLDGVRTRRLAAAHRHLASTVLRDALAQLVGTLSVAGGDPGVVIATPVGHPHELVALTIAATAAAQGCRVSYLGPEVPADAIAGAVALASAAVVMLGLGGAPGDRATPRELRQLRRALPARIAIVVHGAETARHRVVLDEVGASVHADLVSLREALRALRTAALGADGPAGVLTRARAPRRSSRSPGSSVAPRARGSSP